jgi:3-oxoacyl-[acyl-carrier protein] reductase
MNRVAVVTGAARGLGAAIAERLLADGYQVAFADLNLEGARETAAVSGDDAFAVEVDIRRLESVERCLAAVVDRYGGVDVWVNNAALTIARSFFAIDPDEWDDVVATNLRGTYYGCRVAGLHMRERGGGRIVNLASIAGQRGASTNQRRHAHALASRGR